MPTETRYTDAAPLACFRILFGLMMVFSIVRFWANGWIEKLYLAPTFHFKYYGFEWVKVPSPFILYMLFFLCGISAFAVAIGFKYRLSMTSFFLSFTYIELMDKTTYLNHYYFISVISFMMIFLPAQQYFSWDKRKGDGCEMIPKIYINSLKIFISIVYIYAGLAKLNPDWIFKAMPLAIWLPSKFNIPILGSFLHESWLHFAFSWAGALYDLSIVFLLLYRPTRTLAYGVLVLFHILTGVLFPIGIFPYVMIVSALLFFEAPFHHKILNGIARLVNFSKEIFNTGRNYRSPRLIPYMLTFVLIIQVLIPLRFLAYPGKLFWTEEGYRFSWRVMLMEKAGYAQFKIQDGVSGKFFMVDNRDFLTSFQEKQMATQPDFIIEYAHYLGDHFQQQGHKNLEVYVESFVALNGRNSQAFVDPSVNLLEINDSFAPRNWILPFND